MNMPLEKFTERAPLKKKMVPCVGNRENMYISVKFSKSLKECFVCCNDLAFTNWRISYRIIYNLRIRA